MSPLTSVRHQFVEFVPRQLEDGVLYISLAYNTAVHKCACGCGSKVTTPIGPTKWRVTYDGETVSLYPSIGNWSYACRSHYWITGNRVEWSPSWSQEEITAARARDREDRERFYRSGGGMGTTQTQGAVPRPGLIEWLRKLFRA